MNETIFIVGAFFFVLGIITLVLGALNNSVSRYSFTDGGDFAITAGFWLMLGGVAGILLAALLTVLRGG